jgi:hypothetical protein
MTEEKRISPWIAGVVDTLVGARVILGTNIPHRNRLAVILMDAALETACRAFLKHRKRIALSDAHRHRDNLVKAVRGNLKEIDDVVWESINYYYEVIGGTSCWMTSSWVSDGSGTKKRGQTP